jgi:hypothetical protein
LQKTTWLFLIPLIRMFNSHRLCEPPSCLSITRCYPAFHYHFNFRVLFILFFWGGGGTHFTLTGPPPSQKLPPIATTPPLVVCLVKLVSRVCARYSFAHQLSRVTSLDAPDVQAEPAESLKYLNCIAHRLSSGLSGNYTYMQTRLHSCRTLLHLR